MQKPSFLTIASLLISADGDLATGICINSSQTGRQEFKCPLCQAMPPLAPKPCSPTPCSSNACQDSPSRQRCPGWWLPVRAGELVSKLATMSEATADAQQPEASEPGAPIGPVASTSQFLRRLAVYAWCCGVPAVVAFLRTTWLRFTAAAAQSRLQLEGHAPVVTSVLLAWIKRLQTWAIASARSSATAGYVTGLFKGLASLNRRPDASSGGQQRLLSVQLLFGLIRLELYGWQQQLAHARDMPGTQPQQASLSQGNKPGQAQADGAAVDTEQNWRIPAAFQVGANLQPQITTFDFLFRYEQSKSSKSVLVQGREGTKAGAGTLALPAEQQSPGTSERHIPRVADWMSAYYASLLPQWQSV